MKFHTWYVTINQIRWKSVGAGIIMAILILSTSMWLYERPHNVLTESSESINWDFTSSLILSNQLNDQNDRLIALEVYVGIISSPTSWYGKGIFYDNISSFRALQSVESREVDYYLDRFERYWNVWIYADKTPTFSHYDFNLGEVDFSSLTLSFSYDILNLGEIIDITDRGLSVLQDGQSQIGALYWRIWQIFDDGTWIWFELFDNLLVIRYIQLEYVYGDPDSGLIFGPYDPNEAYPTFMSTIEGEALPHFTIAINLFLEKLLSG